ncbi:hypothetical protein ACIQM4_19350 [Streptomyces sp. NPDC091272]|uniref:hypothetical protein n=1 Tax=Streptomyces sp. NPDC091272 TaxID=3365981 RepID=UPI0038186440
MAEQTTTTTAAPPALSAENLEALMLEERAQLFARTLTEQESDALYAMIPDSLVLESRVLRVVAEMSAHGADSACTPEEIRFQAADRVSRQEDVGLPLRNEMEWRSGLESRMEVDIFRLMAQLPTEPFAALLDTLPADQQNRLRVALAASLVDHTAP